MQNPKDSRFAKPGNRLFRNAAMQRQSRTKLSWQMVALAITVLFTSAGATFWYFSVHDSAPTPAAAPAPTPAATPAATLPPPPTVTPTPSPTPTPEPKETPKPKASKAKEKSNSDSGGSPAKTKAKAGKTKSSTKSAPPPKEVVKSAHKVLEPGEASPGAKKTDRESSGGDEVKTRSADKGESRGQGETKKSSAKASAKTVSATPPAVPMGEPQAPEAKETPRPRFNMNPESMRSANTDRVSKTAEFPSDPTPGPAKPAAKASGGDAPAVPVAPAKKSGAKKASPESGGIEGNVN